ncbi:LuxR family transcriptional regulator [Bradyrhizobium sp. S3.9.1]|uniref:helix-turn-helix transcriptional regulator n=1 Tax=Bradyrhizobium sp. S3.9.1 TaxID=3156431 RepID=UPI0033985502
MQRAAFEFIERVENLASANAVMTEIGAALRHRGIEHYLFSFVALPSETFADVTLASALPVGLAKAYDELGLVHHDPGFRHSQRTARPFRWFKDVPYDPEAEPRAQEVVNFCRDFGLVDGVVVPFGTLARRLGQVWFGGPQLDLQKRDIPALHLMALYAFDRVLQIKGVASTVTTLTAREREVLTRTAVGEKAEQIAVAINVSRHTVVMHLNNCRRKLGASTLAQAVAIAMGQRMIMP